MDVLKYLFMLIFYSRADALISIDNENNVVDYLEEVTKLNTKTHPAGYFLVICADERTTLVDKLSVVLQQKLLKKTLVINSNRNLDDFSQEINPSNKHLGYIKLIYVFASTTEDITNVLNLLGKLSISNTRTKILIIAETIENQRQIIEIFQHFWASLYLNVSLIKIYNDTITTLTFNPFWKDDITIENVSPENLFYNKLININKKPFRLMLLRHDDFSKQIYVKLPNNGRFFFGPEITIFQTLVANMNGKLEIEMSDRHLLPNERNPWRNGNFDNEGGLDIKLRILKQGRFDCLSSEEMIQADNLRGATESLYPHANDDMLIIMRKGRPLPHYMYIKFIFTQEVWFYFLTVLFISLLTWLLISKSDKYKVVIKFINLIRMLTGGGIDTLPKVLSEQIFVIFWIIYSLIIITAFTSKLASTFMEIKFETNINTLDELDEAGYILYGYRTQIKHLQKAYNGTSRYPFFKKMRQVPDKYDHLNAEDNNYTEFLHVFTQQHPSVLNRGRAELLAKLPLLKFLLHIVKDSPLPNYVAFQVPIGSAYYDRMNLVLRRFIESGIYQFWFRSHETMVIRMYPNCPKHVCVKIEKMTPLSLRHFQAAFIILFFGVVSSLVIFLVELILFNIKNIK